MSTLSCFASRQSFLSLVLVTVGCASDYNLSPTESTAGETATDRGLDGLPDEEADGEDSAIVVPVEPIDPDIEEEEPEGEHPEQPSADRPEAFCGVEPTVIRPIYDTATWSGGGIDPNGYEIVDYDWSLVSAPTGSSVFLVADNEDTVVFQPDLAGVYAAQLVVTNELGIESHPCRVALDAVPGQALWVEMFWTQQRDDMDLHLLAPGGSMGSDSDCYFDNCTPDDGGLDWGVVNDSRDDPFLDLDDVAGVGPENINIEEPVDGVYRVLVHDWPDSVNNAANSVTVKIYLDGEAIWTDTRNIAGEDTVTEFATVDTSNGEVQPR